MYSRQCNGEAENELPFLLWGPPVGEHITDKSNIQMSEEGGVASYRPFHWNACLSLKQRAANLRAHFKTVFSHLSRYMLGHKPQSCHCVICYPTVIGRMTVCISPRPDRFLTDSRCRFVRNGAITVEGGCFISICESVKSPLFFSHSPLSLSSEIRFSH